MEEIRVASWSELQERLFDHSWNEELGLHRSNYAYRVAARPRTFRRSSSSSVEIRRCSNRTCFATRFPTTRPRTGLRPDSTTACRGACSTGPVCALLADSRPDQSFDDWLGEHGELARRIVIPAELNWEVRDKLDQANLAERVLFPASTADTVARALPRAAPTAR
jgi:hypothetical protein